MAIGDSNVSRATGVLGRADHITVSENIFNAAGTTFCAASHPGSRLFPPAPLTGDVGRDRGDAGRALLFLRQRLTEPVPVELRSRGTIRCAPVCRGGV